MYPGTIFNWHDNSGIEVATTSTTNDSAPLLMQVFSADKGTEDLIEISGSDFDAMYGTMSFTRHGQSAIQAKRIIDAGGRLLAKRVVASDSTLANLVLIATVEKKNLAQVTLKDGTTIYLERNNKDEYEKLDDTHYKDSNGFAVSIDDVVSATGKTIKASVKWESKNYSELKTLAKVEEEAKKDFDEAGGKFPIFIYTDNGRGVSGKAVRLTPDYATSKNVSHTFYNISVYEGTSITEQTCITVDPDVVYNNVAYGFDKYSNVQISGSIFRSGYDAYVKFLADALSIDEDTLKSYDIVYGYTNRGSEIEGFGLDTDSVDLDAATGIALDGGSDGVFTSSPMTSTEGLAAWTNAVANVFKGYISDKENPESDTDATTIDEVFDVDQHMIAAICDANYPVAVKNAIFDFVEFRQDCVFLRDYGTGLTTFAEIKDKYESFAAKRNYFTADYATSYLVYDPETRKTIEVTMTYDMAPLIVNSIENAPYAPLAGTVNGFVLSAAIKGTINFVPVNTPKVNQKEAIDEIRVNYAIFEDNNCVVQSCYTCQDPYTQLSYLCNTIAIQRVLRAVRIACPRQRYSLSTGTDLQTYANAVNNVLSNYTSNFAVLNFNYTQDNLRAAQRIFYASIEFAFLGWAQTEIFDVYAINN